MCVPRVQVVNCTAPRREIPPVLPRRAAQGPRAWIAPPRGAQEPRRTTGLAFVLPIHVQKLGSNSLFDARQQRDRAAPVAPGAKYPLNWVRIARSDADEAGRGPDRGRAFGGRGGNWVRFRVFIAAHRGTSFGPSPASTPGESLSLPGALTIRALARAARWGRRGNRDGTDDRPARTAPNFIRDALRMTRAVVPTRRAPVRARIHNPLGHQRTAPPRGRARKGRETSVQHRRFVSETIARLGGSWRSGN